VTRLVLLAVLILATVALAGEPPCTKLSESVQYITVGPSRTITITFDATQWGIPKLGNWITIPKGNSLTVAADPQPSDGKWNLLVRVTYTPSYGLAVYTYTIDCSGTITTWVRVTKTWESPPVTVTLADLKDQPLTLSYRNSWTVNVAPPVGEVVPNANEYDVSRDWPENKVYISYVINGANNQLSGLSPSTSSNPSWNYGEKVASYVPTSLKLVFINGDGQKYPPAAETYGRFSGRCKGREPPIGANSYSETITCTSYGSIDVKITAALPNWVGHKLTFWTFSGIAGYLENFLYVVDTESGYVALYRINKDRIPFPCKPPLDATQVAYVGGPPKGVIEALSFALWDMIGRPVPDSSTTWSTLMTYGQIEKRSICYSRGKISEAGVEAGVVYVWRYSPDLLGGAWIEVGGARGEASGVGELRPTVYIWLPQGGVYSARVKVGGWFIGLDGAKRQTDFSEPSGWRNTAKPDSPVSSATCPNFARVGSGSCLPTYDMAWDGEWVELGTRDSTTGRELWHWRYPSYSGGTPLYWVGWHSRAKLNPRGLLFTSYISMHPGWGTVAWSRSPPMPDPQSWLSGDVSFTFIKNYDVRLDRTRWSRGLNCEQVSRTNSPPVLMTDACGFTYLNADVALAFGVQSAFLPPIDQINDDSVRRLPEPADEHVACNDPCCYGACKPILPLGDCVLVQPTLISLAPGAYGFRSVVYATAPFNVIWPNATFVLVVGMPHSANCPPSVNATIRLYARHVRTGFTGFIGVKTELRRGEWYYISPSNIKPYKEAICGRFTDTGLNDWYNAPQEPGFYMIEVKYGNKTQYFHYEVKPVELLWRSYTPIYYSTNIFTGIVATWIGYVGSVDLVPWWPYGAGRGGLAMRYGCSATYWSEVLSGDFTYSIHFGDLIKAKVQYVDLTPKVRYIPGKGVELTVDVAKPPGTEYFYIGWYVYVNRHGGWNMVGFVRNNSTRLLIPQVDIPVWPWDPVLIVPLVIAYGKGDQIYHYKPGYVLFFNFWSLPLTDPPAQSNPDVLVYIISGAMKRP